MSAPEAQRPFVLILLGKESDAEVMAHTVAVLDALQIAHETVQIGDLGDEQKRSAFFDEASSRGLSAVIIGTYYAYTDELSPTVTQTLLPVFKVITGPVPTTPEQITLNTALMGFGADAARNAGQFAARILALNDPALNARLSAFMSS